LYAGIDIAAQFPHVKAWLDRVLARPAVQRGLLVPSGEPSRISIAVLEEAEREGSEDGKKLVEARKIVAEAKEKYGYKYASP
jgi:hypothetical protein